MADTTPHALGFTTELQEQLWCAERRLKELKAQQPNIKHPEVIGLAGGRIHAQEWLVKSIKQALAREAPKGRE